MSSQSTQSAEMLGSDAGVLADPAELSTMNYSQYTHNTAPTRFAQVGGSRFAYAFKHSLEDSKEAESQLVRRWPEPTPDRGDGTSKPLRPVARVSAPPRRDHRGSKPTTPTCSERVTHERLPRLASGGP